MAPAVLPGTPTHRLMPSSMTGFGRATARAGATEATVEVRSVNGRFAEVTVRAPRALAEHEAALQAAARERLERGNITVNVTLSRSAAAGPLRVDADAAHARGDLLRALRSAAGVPDAPITVADLLAGPDVLTAASADDAAERAEALDAARAALDGALDALDAMRRREGDALVDDLRVRCDLIETRVAAVEARAPARVADARARLAERLAEMLDDDRLDRARLETEIALLADKLDVTEETVRLRSHLAQFRAALDADETVGRRLTFLSQEINREVNTIGSKANDAEITALSVAMKEDLEKIREQVQNLA
jgi:uncharacterized protein (TIGR00255 family)